MVLTAGLLLPALAVVLVVLVVALALPRWRRHRRQLCHSAHHQPPLLLSLPLRPPLSLSYELLPLPMLLSALTMLLPSYKLPLLSTAVVPLQLPPPMSRPRHRLFPEVLLKEQQQLLQQRAQQLLRQEPRGERPTTSMALPRQWLLTHRRLPPETLPPSPPPPLAWTWFVPTPHPPLPPPLRLRRPPSLRSPPCSVHVVGEISLRNIT